jgi:response regulator RpfG family c-di-GMP phosphodiesterase
VSAPPSFLFVDDETRILSALRRALRREGWEILLAETPGEALALLGQRPVDVVVSDQKMPGMSGLQLLAEVACVCPQARRVLLTGWPEEVPREQLAQIGVSALVAKPWDDSELKAVLRAQLEG